MLKNSFSHHIAIKLEAAELWDLFKRTPPMLGLSVTGTDIKVCGLQRSHQQYGVELCALELLSSSTEQARAGALQNLIEKTGIEGRQVALAVSGPAVFTRVLQIEKGLKETELQDQIELGLETWFPFPIEEIFYDFTILDTRPSKTKTEELYIAVARRAFIQSQREWVESFGLKRQFGIKLSF